MTERETHILESYGACRRLGLSHYSATTQVAAAFLTTARKVSALVKDYEADMEDARDQGL